MTGAHSAPDDVPLTRRLSFAAWAPGALVNFPGIAEGADAPVPITGRDALALLRAAHAAGWTAGAAQGRAQGRALAAGKADDRQ